MSGPASDTSTLIAAGAAELLAENEIEPGRITPHKTFDGAGVRLRHLALDANTVMTDHSAPRPIVVSVVAGRIRLTVGDATHTMVAGGLIHIDANVRHELFADEPSHVLIYLLAT